MHLVPLLLLLLAGCASGVEVPVQNVPGTREAKQPIPARLAMPSGSGPFPAVILLHGCGGVGSALNSTTQLNTWAARVTDWGYAALIPDSFTPRGVGSVCPAADQPKVTPIDRTGDVISAALYLRGRADIDGSRIAVIGFSHGGATAARLAVPPAGTFRPRLIRAAVDYYGSCVGSAAYTGLPLLALAGDADDWGNPAATCRLFGDVVGKEKPFSVVVYPGVVHAFDNPAIQRRTTNQGHPLQYDEVAAEDSFRKVHDFLDQYLR